jgi:hypothetical protein
LAFEFGEFPTKRGVPLGGFFLERFQLGTELGMTDEQDDEDYGSREQKNPIKNKQ